MKTNNKAKETAMTASQTRSFENIFRFFDNNYGTVTEVIKRFGDTGILGLIIYYTRPSGRKMVMQILIGKRGKRETFRHEEF